MEGLAVPFTNEFGWQPAPPSVPERRVGKAWMEPKDFLGHLAHSLVTGGLPLLAGFGLGNPWIGIGGVVFVALGIGLVVWLLRRREVRPEPP
jgi:hypothetical protein